MQEVIRNLPGGTFSTIERKGTLMNWHFGLLLGRRPIRLIAGDLSLAKTLFFLLLPVALCLSGCSDDRGSIKETKQRGNQIIQALEQSRAARGQYPKSLADLSPKYIQELPSPAWGLKTWQYESDGKEFTLRVDESVRTGDGNSHWLRYQGKKWGWQIGD